ncbi:hypothetical protein GMDG_06174 [Pseudogymnoascus destructans 20631-21]|uniref:RING-type domain-containing protein n=1 Tax=Pseudogymnoascus destructans (strain ATCC MYA-4855 / 20631-21) TaxID=658429 RepID=L8FUL6_PSED2|nr:hypothetical protein GMDG_06174 [Pseudogymnoascus destructans 20631-21]
MKFFRTNFFHRYTDGSKERTLASLKRRAQAAQRRRYTVQSERPAPAQVITPPSNPPATPDEPSEQTPPEPATAPAPETRQPGIDAASQTPPPTSPPADDEPDPFDDTLEAAIEISASELAASTDIRSKVPASTVREIEVSSLLKEADEEEKVNPNAGPKCDICQEFTEIARIGGGEDAGKVEKMASLPCGHKFGHRCLLAWLDQALGQTCPLCRSLPVHEECGHAVIPALASEAPPSWKGNGGEWEVPPKCMSCRVESDPGKQLLRYQWQMEEARGMALVSMRQVPNEWAESRIQLEWVRMSERTRNVEGTWGEELERSWLQSQRGRNEW